MQQHTLSDERFQKQISKLEAQFASGPPLDASDPKVYREICRQYGEIVRPGLEAADRALLVSRATAQGGYVAVEPLVDKEEK